MKQAQALRNVEAPMALQFWLNEASKFEDPYQAREGYVYAYASEAGPSTQAVDHFVPNVLLGGGENYALALQFDAWAPLTDGSFALFEGGPKAISNSSVAASYFTELKDASSLLRPQTLNTAILVTAEPESDQKHEASLSKLIQAERDMVEVDEDYLSLAEIAVGQAKTFVDREMPDERPVISVTDDGHVLLHWRGVEAGLLLAFTGEPCGYYAIKRPGSFFAGSEVPFDLDAPLPSEALAMLRELAPVCA